MDDTTWRVLFQDVRTLEEAYELDDELRGIEQVSFQLVARDGSKVSLLKQLEKIVSYKTANKLQLLADKQLIDFASPESLRQFFDLAHKQVMKVPRLQLQLAIEVNEQLLDSIYKWIKGAVNKPVFLELVVKPNVMAGCIIVYAGIYKDYSVRFQLEEQAEAIFKPIMAQVGENG